MIEKEVVKNNRISGKILLPKHMIGKKFMLFGLKMKNSKRKLINNGQKLIYFMFVFVILVLCVFLVYALPDVSFELPTPSDSSSQLNTDIYVNVSSSSGGALHYTFVDFDRDLVLWMRMDDVNSSGDPTDLSTYSHNGSLVANAGLNISGRFGNSSDLDGAGDYINIKDSSNLEGFSQMTISVWVNTTSQADSNEDVIVGKWDSKDTYLLRYDSNANELDWYTGDGGNSYGGVLAEVSIEDGQWHHIVAVYSGTTMYGYLDGSILGTTFNRGGDIGQNSMDVRIGNSPNAGQSATDYFNGSIDEVLIFKRALTESEILSLYNATANQYFHNFTGLSSATHNFTAYSVNSSGNKNSTGIRNVTISASSISIDYPSEYVLFQRHNSSTGEIKIVGTYDGTPTGIEANFDGQGWISIDSSPSGNAFTGYLNASVGQGNLSVRFADDVAITDAVNNISIGDLFIIAGQSNAEGRASYAQELNSSNQYIATVYKQNNLWQVANDPIDVDSSSGTPFPLLANYIIQNQSVPVSFISVAEGGTNILQWQKTFTNACDSVANGCYNGMIDQITDATNGTMKVKALLWHQGESDANPGTGTDGNYTDYKNNLSLIASDFLNDTEVAETTIVTQIGYKTTGSTDRNRMDNIRRAQNDLWDEDENISAGATLYDIGPLSDGVHFKTNAEIQELAKRWWVSIGNVIYSVGDGRGPVLVNASFNNEQNSSILLNFSEDNLNLLIRQWSSSTDRTKATGWRILSGDLVLGDENISSTTIDGNLVYINLSVDLTGLTNISLGSFNDGSAQNITRDNSTYFLPAETIYQFNLNNFVVTPSTASVQEKSESILGGLPIYCPTESNLQEGYEIILKKNWKIRFKYKDESHQLNLDRIVDEDTIQITISSDPIIFNLSLGEIKKVNLDNDSYYDLKIFLRDMTNYSAKIAMILISEEIPDDIFGDDRIVKSEFPLFYGLFLLAVFLIGFGVYLIIKKKKLTIRAPIVIKNIRERRRRKKRKFKK